jgi:hypothetical protein
MENDVYRALISGLATQLGAAQPLASGNGARFTSPHKGKATVYHREIAPGNRAEIAFHRASMAERLGMSEVEFAATVDQWRLQTARPVQLNQQYLWPRVGFSSVEQVSTFLSMLWNQE